MDAVQQSCRNSLTCHQLLVPTVVVPSSSHTYSPVELFFLVNDADQLSHESKSHVAVMKELRA